MKKFLAVCAIALCLVLFSACVKKSGDISTPAGSTSSIPSTSPGTVIVAESSNAVSDTEKQAVLDNLSKEIDNAFNAGNQLQDPSDSDLDPNNIP